MCKLCGGFAGAQAEDPVGELGICSFDAVTVDFQEGQHGDERQAFVAIDERLALGDPVREHPGLQREIGLALARHRRLPLGGLAGGIVLGENLQRLRVFGHHTPPHITDALADLVSWDDPQLTTLELFNQHRGSWRVAARLKLARNRNHIAVADPTNLDDFHTLSIYTDIRDAFTKSP